MISFDSMSHIQVTLMQEVGFYGLWQLSPCAFADSLLDVFMAGVECLWLFQVCDASCQWIYDSGLWRMVALFSQLH